MSTTSEHPEPLRVLQPSSTTTPPSVLPCHGEKPQSEEEQIIKFLIGLRLLGEKRQKRFLQYMEDLQHPKNGKRRREKQ